MKHTFKIMEFSTANVSESAAEFFDTGPDYSKKAKQPFMHSEYGWIFTVPDSDDFDLVDSVGCEGFSACMRKAAQAGCDYAIFDNVLMPVDGLPVYDW